MGNDYQGAPLTYCVQFTHHVQYFSISGRSVALIHRANTRTCRDSAFIARDPDVVQLLQPVHYLPTYTLPTAPDTSNPVELHVDRLLN